MIADRVRHAGHARGPVRRWVDRLYMTAAYRELRSTWTVRGRAATLLGHSGRWLTALNVLLWLSTAGRRSAGRRVAETSAWCPPGWGCCWGCPG